MASDPDERIVQALPLISEMLVGLTVESIEFRESFGGTDSEEDPGYVVIHFQGGHSAVIEAQAEEVNAGDYCRGYLYVEASFRRGVIEVGEPTE